MINITPMIMMSIRNADGSFFLWAETNDHTAIDPTEWIPLLFSWHEETFFGTNVEIVERHEKHGVLLSAWSALDFFARSPHSSLADVTFSEDAKTYEQIAISLFDAINDGDFQPDYAAWKSDAFAWKAGTDSIANEWLSFALQDLMMKDEDLQETWERLSEQYPLITSRRQDQFPFGEQLWLERIGWKKDATPFTVGLRLSEPEDDEQEWKLDIMLRDKERPDDIRVLENAESLPEEWHASLERIETESVYWLNVAPWLETTEAEAPIRQQLTELEAWRFLTDTSLQLAEAGVEVMLPAWWKELQRNKPQLKMHVQSTAGAQQTFVGLDQLISFDWKVATDGLELSEEEFNELISENRRLVQIQGKWVTLDPEFVKEMQAIMKQVNATGLSFADVLAKQMLSDEEADDTIVDNHSLANVTLELNEHLLTMLDQLRQTKAIPELPVPDEFVGTLRPYQKQGMEWLSFLHQYRLGALLADDMGLGKTIQTIAYFLTIRERSDEKKPMLIICPTSVLGNWQKEFERFAPSLRVLLHYGPKRATETDFEDALKDVDVVLTSYNLAHIDVDVLSSMTWGAVCLDEAQNIKNMYTKQARAVKMLKAEHKLALTGTPIENRLTELWSLFDFLNPGYFGSVQEFRQRFVIPIEKERDKQKIRAVQQLIRPFFMRRSKLDPEIKLNLPEKQEQKEFTPLTAEQASLYEQIIADTFHEIERRTGIERRGLILALLTKLKQVCNHPALFLNEWDADDIKKRSYKSQKLLELVTAIREQNESCLIFTQYVGMGKMLTRLLQSKLEEPVSFLYGSVSKHERDRMITRFQAGEESILILSLKAGGTGLNLTAANHVIHYDRWWNPAVENQATDRAHRIGQERFVHVHKLITTGTLEEKIDEMLERKQALSDEIIQSEHWITELPTEQLRDLFMLRHG